MVLYFQLATLSKQLVVGPVKMQSTLDYDIDSNDPTRTMKGSFGRFKELLLSHAVERPPSTSGIFSVEDVGRIVEYMLNSYFRHYSLYRYIFTKRLAVTLLQTSPHVVESPPPPPPLEEALPQVIEYAPRVTIDMDETSSVGSYEK
mmetsp:Transcript_11199/g.26299  ORF Transcript_11199/g.26299 Transcript_11199/m.26299 type:complete len:146 (+) Transcript_11199:502-939(+)